MDENTIKIVIIVCVIVFILSFCILYFKLVKKFFMWIFKGIKKFFSLFKKVKKKKAVKESNDRAQKSIVQIRPIMLPAPESKDKEVLNEAQEKVVKSKTFTLDASNAKKQSALDKQKQELMNLINMSNEAQIRKDESEKGVQKVDINDDDLDLEDDEIGLSVDEDDEIINKIKENSTVEVDGEKIDLTRLPLKIRRLLLSGILDRKEDL